MIKTEGLKSLIKRSIYGQVTLGLGNFWILCSMVLKVQEEEHIRVRSKLGNPIICERKLSKNPQSNCLNLKSLHELCDVSQLYFFARRVVASEQVSWQKDFADWFDRKLLFKVISVLDKHTLDTKKQIIWCRIEENKFIRSITQLSLIRIIILTYSQVVTDIREESYQSLRGILLSIQRVSFS